MVTLAIDGRLSGVRTGLLWGVRAAVIADIQQGGPRGNNFVARTEHFFAVQNLGGYHEKPIRMT